MDKIIWIKEYTFESIYTYIYSKGKVILKIMFRKCILYIVDRCIRIQTDLKIFGLRLRQ